MTSLPSPESWQNVLTLDARQQIVAGDPQALRRALANGADLRIYSEFRHNEHIDTRSASDELVQETMDMRVTYLVDGRWSAGITTLRQPVELPAGFGPRPSLSLFLYNERWRPGDCPALPGWPTGDWEPGSVSPGRPFRDAQVSRD